ncbi:leptin receptor [Vipera latastei]
MNWNNILSGFLQLNFFQVVISHCMVYQIPPQSFEMPCIPARIAEDGPTWQDVHGTIGANATVLVAEDNFLCCHWSDTYMNCFAHTAEMEAKAFISSRIVDSTLQQIDLIWNLQFWTNETTEELFCIMKLSTKSPYLNEDFTVNLLHALTDASLENSSTNSLKENSTVTHCNTLKARKYECQISSVKLNHIYIMWLKITNGNILLQSPLMSVKPIDVVKPDPPLHLQVEMTDTGQLKISWSQPASKSNLFLYEVKCFTNSTKSFQQVAKITMGTSLTINNELLESSYIIQIRCKNHQELGLWSDWSSPFNLDLQDVMYFPSKLLASVGTNISFYCIYKTKNKMISSKKIVWWLNLAKEIPSNQYTFVNDYTSKITLTNLPAMKPGGKFLFNALYCCNENKECNHRYAELYIIDANINITCETYGNLQKMTCSWSIKPDPILLESTLLLRYYRNDIYCSESPSMHSDSEVKECNLLRNNVYECIFQPFYLLSGYTMWIEIKHSLGTITSRPVCVLPKEVVKPFSPFSVRAEITEDTGQLKVSWNNPELPKNDLQFQVRYMASGEDINWKIQEVSAVSVTSVSIAVQDPCTVYMVQVRCSMTEGIGYWSDWSRSAYTVIKDIKAPLRGPEFWRVINEDPTTNQKNVTLLWKPLMKNLSLCSVLDYVVEHNTSENIAWSDYIENDTTYIFSWSEDIHSVKILAINSIGPSSVNFILTLSQRISTVNIVQSLNVYPMNSSCVIMSWTLLPMDCVVTSFVIEWTNLNGEEQIKWITAPSNVRRYHIFDNFVLIEKYRFSLYPVINEGITKPAITEGFSKDGIEKQHDVNFYVILPLMISCSFLLLGALLILQHRIKKLLWVDVPNPKNCSWAQGVNFQKPESFEHLFLKHPEAMSFGPLLLESEIVLEDVSIDKAMKHEDKQELLAVDSLFATIQDFEHDSSCSSGHFKSDSFSENVHDGENKGGKSEQCNVKYATIISGSMSSGLYGPPKDLSSPFDRGFVSLKSSGPASFSSISWAVGNQAFFILPDYFQDPPRKTVSLSVVSTEGFSESSEQDKTFSEGDSPERGLFYLGMGPLRNNENGIFLTENSNVAPCNFHTNTLIRSMRISQNVTPDLNAFICDCKRPLQTFIPYMPQFQTLTVKIHETANSKT